MISKLEKTLTTTLLNNSNELAFVMRRIDWITSKICHNISCNILFEIVYRPSLRHISLDDVWLYAACNAQISDETAEVH